LRLQPAAQGHPKGVLAAASSLHIGNIKRLEHVRRLEACATSCRQRTAS